jgi:uroporphyrinogen III methyltransferase/synthase
MPTLYTGLTSPDANYIHTPLIEIVSVDDDTQLRRAIADIDSYDYVLFTSRYAAKYVGALSVMHTRIVSIGRTTTKALHQIGVEEVDEVEEDNSYGVVSWFSSQSHGRVLIPRSNLALPIIPEGLRQLGFEVDCITAYINRMPEHPKKVNLDEIDRIVFTSPSTIDNFIRLYGALPEKKELVTRGPITEQHLQTILKQR